MAVVQQAFVLATRAWLRVVLLGSEIALVDRLTPPPVAAEPAHAAPVPEPPLA